MKVTCLVCDQEMPSDEEYIVHMETVHGGQSQMDAMKTSVSKKANLPPPTPEFMETLAAMESEPQTPPAPSPAPPPPQPAPKPEPLQLTYKYSGHCSNGHDVTTLEMDIDKRHFVVAYCLQEKIQIESRGVDNLENNKVLPNLSEENSDNSLPIETRPREILHKKMRRKSKRGKVGLEQGSTSFSTNQRENTAVEVGQISL